MKSVEQFVNARIQENLALIEQRQVPLDEAKKSGAIMLFGEKYGDTVRTIRFGQSTELCGGTHVQNTGEIWHFKIMTESAIASGIRRIEAITKDVVRDYYFEQDEVFGKVKSALKNTTDILKSVLTLQEENTKLKKEIEQLNKLKTASFKEQLIKNKKLINGVNFVGALLDADAGSMKSIAFEIANELDDLFFIGGSNLNGKALLTIYISKNLVETKSLNAGNIIRELGKHIQGGGGGQAFFATAGGKNPGGLKAALEAAEKIIEN